MSVYVNFAFYVGSINLKLTVSCVPVRDTIRLLVSKDTMYVSDKLLPNLDTLSSTMRIDCLRDIRNSCA